MIFDNAGNLYGATNSGGIFWGTVFQLTPSGSGWTETVLHNFQSASDGGFPAAGLISDASGNLYGTTGAYGPQGGGTVFELSSPDDWTFNLLYGFRCSGDACYSLPGPQASLFMDSSGNLFGTTTQDGAYGYGNVFKLTPRAGGWIYSDASRLHGRQRRTLSLGQQRDLRPCEEIFMVLRPEVAPMATAWRGKLHPSGKEIPCL